MEPLGHRDRRRVPQQRPRDRTKEIVEKRRAILGVDSLVLGTSQLSKLDRMDRLSARSLCLSTPFPPGSRDAPLQVLPSSPFH